MKTEGLFRNFTREGVSAYVSRRIKIRRPEIDLGRESKGWPARTVRPRRCSHCRRRDHTGELGTGARGHDFPNRRHRGLAGEQGILAKPRARPEGRAEVAVAMAGSADVVGAHG